MTSTFLLLVQHPDVQERLYKESFTMTDRNTINQYYKV